MLKPKPNRELTRMMEHEFLKAFDGGSLITGHFGTSSMHFGAPLKSHFGDAVVIRRNPHRIEGCVHGR